MFKRLKLDEKCFDVWGESELVSPSLELALQMATMFDEQFAEMTMGICPGHFAVATFDLSPHGMRVVENEKSNRLRVIQNHLEAGNIHGRKVKAGGWECDVKHAIQWACEQGWELPEQMLSLVSKTPKTSVPLELDKSNAKYPYELDMALQAWLFVSSTEGKGKPKARIRDWLNKNTTLTNDAKERIAVVANWDKTGGATRTE